MDRSTLSLAALPRALAWPVALLVVTGSMHFVLEAVRPDLRTAFVAPALAPLLLAYGAWTGSRAVDAGAGIVGAIVAGIGLGLLPLALDVVGFGIVLGRGVDAGTTAGLYGFSMVVFGSLVGSGYRWTTPAHSQV